MSNAEGYHDPTADQAIHNATKMPRRIKDVYRALQAVAGLHGLEITGLRDRRTGERWYKE